MQSCDIPLPDVFGASFRDPSGRVIVSADRVIRLVNGEGIADLTAFLDSPAAQKYVASGQIVGTRFLERNVWQAFPGDIGLSDFLTDPVGLNVVEHEQIPFRNYPHEWPPEMLHAAGALMLELAESLIVDGLGLKDGTPYNVLYRGPSPVFVDVLSFERRDPADPIWLPYAQFVRTVLLPLLVNKHFGVTVAQIFAGRRDGMEPEEAYRLASPIKRLMPSFLSLVSIPTWLGKGDPDKDDIYKKRVLHNREKAKFILQSFIRRLKHALKRLEPECRMTSTWSEYMHSNNYSEAHLRAKDGFVSGVLCEFAPKRVLDVGCNTGHFSALAAGRGASVVAIDNDPVVVGRLWRRATMEKLDILPLVASISAPTPATGWRNRECLSFLDRAKGRFDCVLMLAVIHHLLVTERVPLSEILELAAEMTTDLCVVEFIGPGDSMFKRLVRGRDNLYAALTQTAFESVCRQLFDIVRTQHVEGTKRWLYLLRKRATWEAS